MNLTEAHTMATDLMREHGVGHFAFRWTESNWRYGETFVEGGVREIRLSATMTAHRKTEDVRNTILHEIAHAMVGVRHQHNEIWVAQARALGVKPTIDTSALVLAMAARA